MAAPVGIQVVVNGSFSPASFTASNSGVSDLRIVATLAIPLGILCGALIVPWCGAQVLAMLGDLQVRQDEVRRARSE